MKKKRLHKLLYAWLMRAHQTIKFEYKVSFNKALKTARNGKSFLKKPEISYQEFWGKFFANETNFGIGVKQ